MDCRSSLIQTTFWWSGRWQKFLIFFFQFFFLLGLILVPREKRNDYWNIFTSFQCKEQKMHSIGWLNGADPKWNGMACSKWIQLEEVPAFFLLLSIDGMFDEQSTHTIDEHTIDTNTSNRMKSFVQIIGLCIFCFDCRIVSTLQLETDTAQYP